ncbi:MAG: 4-hydroxy-tetrahydrodipicolinate reductase [Chthonomonas sp.]|nr:4-hydroxy-tetrahydrodipicolinate reductase [Chthonomonas sp.]
MPKPTNVVKVCLVGACGRMGQEVVRAVANDLDVEIAVAVDRENVGRTLRDVVGPIAPDLVIGDKVGAALDAEECHVLVDFTHPTSAAGHALSALKRGVAVVVGTSGISQPEQREIAMAAEESGTPAMIVPNFAIGAVLMMKFAAEAARWLPNAEIIELHHDAKADAPSGTATQTAQVIADARLREPEKHRDILKVEGARGGDVRGVRIHSIRLPGLLAHQEVLFGSRGETLTIRHDSTDRTGFMDGVKLCCRRVWSLSGLTVGLDALLRDVE